MRSSLTITLLVACACMLLVALAGPASASRSSHSGAPSHLSSPGVPKKHRVSKTTFHTDAGRERDDTRAYAGEGTSHAKHFSDSGRVSAELGQHLFEPAIHAQVTAQLTAAIGQQYAHLVPSIEAAGNGTPEQIRLSITARAGEIVITWLTWNATSSTVRYGPTSGVYTETVTGQVVEFVDPNTLHLVRYIHNVLITDFKAGTQYFYVVGDATSGVFSPEQQFTNVPQGQEVQTVAIYGDLGLVNSQSMAGVSAEVQAKTISSVIHIGDFAYNMDELQGMTGDIFLNDLQNITSSVPLMGCAGNHEAAFNFSHYTNKFSQYNYVQNPAGPADSNWWFSFDMMSGGTKVHYISLDSEIYYWNYYEPEATPERKAYFQQMIANQWNWLVADLIEAYDSGKYGWIIAYSHRPLYCSNVDDVPDCTSDAEWLRLGPGGLYGFETAFAMRPLDMYFAAHEHSYERTYPTRNGTIDTASIVNANVYSNPKYPTHIITGSGGCREYFDNYDQVFYGPWSVVRSATYGYGHLTIHNATHLHWEQLLDEGRGGTDPLWIIKDANLAAKQPEQQQEESVFAGQDEPVAAPDNLLVADM